MAELTLKDINKTLQDNNDMLENLTSDVSEIGRSLLKDQVDRHRQEQTDRRQKSADRLMYLEFLREQKDKGATPHTHSHAGGGVGGNNNDPGARNKKPSKLSFGLRPGMAGAFSALAVGLAGFLAFTPVGRATALAATAAAAAGEGAVMGDKEYNDLEKRIAAGDGSMWDAVTATLGGGVARCWVNANADV